MNNFYLQSLNAAKEKYYKFRNRLEKNISSGEFHKLNRRKKNLLISRVEKYKLRLEGLGFSVKGAMAAAGSFATVSAASAQQAGIYEKAGVQVASIKANQSVVVDIDNDSDLEVVMSTYSGGMIFEGDASSGFTTGSMCIAGISAMNEEFIIGDLDGDDIPDILFKDGNSLYVVINDDYGNFSSAASDFIVSATGSLLDFEIVDIDGDGDNDIAWVDSGGYYYDDVRFNLNDGGGNFGASQGISNVGSSYSILNIAFADLDGDGDTDLVLVRENGPNFETVQVHNNTAGNGSGAGATPVFSVAQTLTVFGEKYSQVQELILEDLDGDGFEDLVTARRIIGGEYDDDGFVNILTGNHSTNNPYFIATDEMRFSSGSSTDLQLTDFDGDGDKDILYANYYSAPYLLSTNKVGEEIQINSAFDLSYGQGFGDFGIDYGYFSSSDFNFSVGDFDGDGLDDLIVGSEIQGSYDGTQLYLNVFDPSPAAINAITAVFNELSAENGRPAALLIAVNSSGTDVSGSVTFSLVAGNGTNDADNSKFEIVNGNQLIAADGVTLDFETQKKFRVRVSATDGSTPINKALTLNLENSPEVGFGTFEMGENLFSGQGGEDIYHSKIIDIDGDGNLDLLYIDSNSGGDLYLVDDFLNNDFSSVSYIGEAYRFDVADIDGDGNLDIVTAEDSYLYLYLGDGEGGFSYDAYLNTDNYSYGVQLVDYDGDGDIDIFSQDRYMVQVFKNEGGEFSRDADLEISGFSGGEQFALGDRDGDGILDMAVLADYGDYIYLFDGNSGGTFSYVGGIELYYKYGIAFTDTDNDGDDDILAVGERYISIHTNDGGSFNSYEYIYLYGDVDDNNPYVVGDFDGDEDVDVLLNFDSDEHGYIAQLFVNGGENNLSPGPRINVDTTGYLYSMAAADLDGDDDLDILIGYWNESTDSYALTVASNQNVAPFLYGFDGEVIVNENTPAGTYLGRVDFGDPNPGDEATIAFNDGDNDNDLFSVDAQGKITVAGEIDWEKTGSDLKVEFTLSDGTISRVEAGELKVRNLIENGKGTFASEGLPLFGLQEPRGIFAADIDLDGDQDLLKSTSDNSGGGRLAGGEDVVLDSKYANSVFIQSQGTFADNPIGGNPSFRITEAAFIDFDNDGDMDIIGGEENRNNVYLFGNGDFGIGQYGTVSYVSSLVGIVSGDFDGDGQQDVAVVGRYEMEILTKNSDFGGEEGPFNISTISLSSGAIAGTIDGVAVGDFDGDGFDDLFLGVSNGDDLIFSGTSSGLVSTGYATAITDTEYGVSGIAVGDFDDDGSPDIAMITSDEDGSSSLDIHLNDGDGNFSLASSTLTGGEYHGELKAGDLDGDGSIDLVLSKFYYISEPSSMAYDIVSNWMNDGDGDFTEGSIALMAAPYGSLELMDVDGDDDFDIVYQDYDTYALYVIKNINAAPTAIDLSSTTIDEGLALGSEVATVTVTDPNISDTHVVFMASGNGTNDTGNSNFVVDGNKLKVIRNIEFNDGATININIKAIDQDGASVTQSFTLTVNEVLGLEDSNHNFIVYPNPGKDRISISLDNQERGKLELRVIDLSGKTVFAMSDEKRSNKWSIPNLDMANAEAGIYIVEIKVNDATMKQRWIKE
ncbi:MAG: FG-GAP-like repeat-containing protein [Ekhidna sp.]|uniref:FG-GAP-like repeat-containing protein n=1 Tax=Ekhidna sp. TaxID=2608089 RepID=UPI0032EE4015